MMTTRSEFSIFSDTYAHKGPLALLFSLSCSLCDAISAPPTALSGNGSPVVCVTAAFDFGGLMQKNSVRPKQITLRASNRVRRTPSRKRRLLDNRLLLERATLARGTRLDHAGMYHVILDHVYMHYGHKLMFSQACTRSDIRERYAIEGDCCSDTFAAMCCTPCELAQESLELQVEENALK